MQIAELNQHPGFAGQTAQLLHTEWSHLPAWSHPPAILERLKQRNQKPNRLVAIAAAAVIATGITPARWA